MNLLRPRPVAAALMAAFSFGVALAAEEAPTPENADTKAAPETKASDGKPVSHASSVTIDGQSIPYTATAAKLILKNDEGKPRASIFHVAYTRDGLSEEERRKRPVMFAFNGGPGSSAVWLHLGILGPKRVDFPGDGTQPAHPPARLIDNTESILDVCDLVFIDPVSTGYSRADQNAKPSDFHGVSEDIESVGDFIRRWVTENNRWASPKLLLGESYGGVRAAGLSDQLQSRYGMSLNGVVLLSSLLDFRTLSEDEGDDMAYPVFLCSYTAVAHFHSQLKGDRSALLHESRRFAWGEYASALLKGTELSEEERQHIADKLATLTGIDATTWLRHNLRIGPGFFRTELLRKEGKVIGRFDGRVAWRSANEAGQSPGYDPSFALAQGAFSTTMLDYLCHDLGWEEEQPYEVLTPSVRPWRWNASNGYVNLSDRLADAMRDNPHLKVLVMCGRTDLATPPEGIRHSFRHLFSLPQSQRGNIAFADYDGGHMFYLNPPDRLKARSDLLKFVRSVTEN